MRSLKNTKMFFFDSKSIWQSLWFKCFPLILKIFDNHFDVNQYQFLVVKCILTLVYRLGFHPHPLRDRPRLPLISSAVLLCIENPAELVLNSVEIFWNVQVWEVLPVSEAFLGLLHALNVSWLLQLI